MQNPVHRTANSKTNDNLFSNYKNPADSERVPQGYVVKEQNQNYHIEIIALESDDPDLLHSLFVGNIDANFHPGQWNASSIDGAPNDTRYFSE